MGEWGAAWAAPLTDGFIGDAPTTHTYPCFHITVTQTEAAREPDSVADNRTRATRVLAVFFPALHRETLREILPSVFPHALGYMRGPGALSEARLSLRGSERKKSPSWSHCQGRADAKRGIITSGARGRRVSRADKTRRSIL